jgi:hypothetical protein
MINENKYKTSDLALATVISLYFPIESIDSSDKRRVFFIFKKSQELNELVDSFWTRKVCVEPQQFFNQLKVIKTRIYSQV